MSAPFRVVALLAAGMAMFAMTASAAELSIEPSAPAYHHHHHWRAAYWVPHAPSEFIAGVRGASPLTVPFFGGRWAPGPVYYYPAPRPCCSYATEPAISVMY
jgi:hypothetical protein